MPAPEDTHDVRVLSEAAVLGALANPARAKLMDVLALERAATLSDLARRTALAPGSAAHHLQALAEVGLVERAPELSRNRRETWWRLADGALRWSRGELTEPSAVTAALAAESAKLTKHFAKARDWLDAQAAPDDPAWTHAAFIGEYWLKLTPDELVELTEQLDAVLQAWRRRPAPAPDPARRAVLVFAHGMPAEP